MPRGPSTHSLHWIIALSLSSVVWVPLEARADCIDGRPVTVGHRGSGNSTGDNPQPENTIPSLLAAAQQGATMVEIDVQLSADGVLVLMHDATVDRTTDGTGCTSELTTDELALLDAGVGTPAAGQGIGVPTLSEVLDAVDLDLNVEIKSGGDGCPVPDPAVVATALLDDLAGDTVDRLRTLSSFDLDVLMAVRDQDASIYIGLLTVTPASLQPAVDADFDALNLIEGSIDEATVIQLRDAGLEVNAWTVDAEPRIGELFGLEVDSIITNDVPLVEQVRAQQCPGTDDTGASEGSGDLDGTGSPGGTATGAMDGSATGTPAQDEQDGGCACRATRGTAGWSWWALVPGLFVRRRRQSKSTDEIVPPVASTSSTPSTS